VQSTTAFPLMLAMLTIQQAYAGQPCDDIETAVQTCIAPETRQRQYGALPVHRSATRRHWRSRPHRRGPSGLCPTHPSFPADTQGTSSVAGDHRTGRPMTATERSRMLLSAPVRERQRRTLNSTS
jgi:hypothetical protein